jgi:hypothetical protein
MNLFDLIVANGAGIILSAVAWFLYCAGVALVIRACRWNGGGK